MDVLPHVPRRLWTRECGVWCIRRKGKERQKKREKRKDERKKEVDMATHKTTGSTSSIIFLLAMSYETLTHTFLASNL